MPSQGAKLAGTITGVSQTGEVGDPNSWANATVSFGKKSAMGLPGSAGNLATYCYCRFRWTVRVYDDMSVTLQITDFTAEQNWIAGALYPVAFYAGTRKWYWQWENGAMHAKYDAAYPGDYIRYTNMQEWTIGVPDPHGRFYWTFNTDEKDICKLTDIGWSLEHQNAGNLYVSGIGLYSGVTQASYPEPVKIEVPNLKVYLDYFPMAVRKSSNWKSCNRPGGSLQRLSSGKWTNIKNTESSSGTNHAFRRSGGGWTKLSKTGTES